MPDQLAKSPESAVHTAPFLTTIHLADPYETAEQYALLCQ